MQNVRNFYNIMLEYKKNYSYSPTLNKRIDEIHKQTKEPTENVWSTFYDDIDVFIRKLENYDTYNNKVYLQFAKNKTERYWTDSIELFDYENTKYTPKSRGNSVKF